MAGAALGVVRVGLKATRAPAAVEAAGAVGADAVGLSGLPVARIAALVEASCAAQDVPVKVAHPTVVRRVSVLLGAVPAAGRGRQRSGTRPAGGTGSVVPGHRNPLGVEPSHGQVVGVDGDVVDQGADDVVLSVQVQARPGAA